MSWAFTLRGSKAAVKRAIEEMPVYGDPTRDANTKQALAAKVYAKHAIDATPGEFVEVVAQGHTDVSWSDASVKVTALHLVGVSVVTPAETSTTDAEPAGESPMPTQEPSGVEQ